MKNKNELWCNIGEILICLGILMSVVIMLYKCFITSISLFVFILGLIIVIIELLFLKLTMSDLTMKTPRCTKCKYFCRSKAKRKVYDHGDGYSESAPSLIDALSTYYCPHKWWNISSLKEIKNGDVCNDFKFK